MELPRALTVYLTHGTAQQAARELDGSCLLGSLLGCNGRALDDVREATFICMRPAYIRGSISYVIRS
jgi:hypothetical protein